jgi:hypothetical protein
LIRGSPAEKEIDMVGYWKRIGLLVLRLLAILLLLGCPQIGSAAGTWSVIAGPQPRPGDVAAPGALAADASGNLYVADHDHGIQKRDAQGNCYENRIPGPVQARGTPAAPRLAAATGR